jgi:hypothetical protein
MYGRVFGQKEIGSEAECRGHHRLHRRCRTVSLSPGHKQLATRTSLLPLVSFSVSVMHVGMDTNTSLENNY